MLGFVTWEVTGRTSFDTCYKGVNWQFCGYIDCRGGLFKASPRNYTHRSVVQRLGLLFITTGTAYLSGNYKQIQVSSAGTYWKAMDVVGAGLVNTEH